MTITIDLTPNTIGWDLRIEENGNFLFEGKDISGRQAAALVAAAVERTIDRGEVLSRNSGK